MTDIVEQLAEQYEDMFLDELSEWAFVFMTEAANGRDSTVAEACDRVVAAINCVEELDDGLQMQAHDLCVAVMKRIVMGASLRY